MSPADLLAFEARWPSPSPDKGARIRAELGITEIRYVVLLGRAAESAEGIAADPLTARRVRDRAARRAAQRERESRMKRKDGRELVTEHPITGIDMIDFITDADLPPLPDGAVACCLREPFYDSSLMDEDPSSDEFDNWGA